MFIMFLFDQLHPDMQCWVEKKIQLCIKPIKENRHICNYLQGKDSSIQKHRRAMFCFGVFVLFFNSFSKKCSSQSQLKNSCSSLETTKIKKDQ